MLRAIEASLKPTATANPKRFYSTVRHYARSPGLAMIDYTAIHKLARTFDVMVEDLVEILEE
jgi:hypothetical protein